MNFFKELLGVTAESGVADSSSKRNAPMQAQSPIITSNRVPFANMINVSFALDPRIVEVVDSTEITHDHIRCSSKLQELLGDIVSNISLFHCWGKQTVKVRLNSFMKMLVEQLCIPTMLSMMGIGSASSALFDVLLAAQEQHNQLQSDAGMKSNRSEDRILEKNIVTKDDIDTQQGYIEGCTADLEFVSSSDISSSCTVQRVKYILKEAFTLFKLSEEALLDGGADDELDIRRFYLFICMMDLKCSTFLSHAATVREYALPALASLSCHVLSVSAVTQCILESIKIVVARLSNALKGETTNSTIVESLPVLEIIIVDYFKWLRENYVQLVKLCRKEEILTAVDKSVRAWLKAENYISPQDLLHVYHKKYSEYLTHMPIPLQPYRSSDIEQAKKDIVREVVVLNKIEYKGGFGSSQSLPLQQLHWQQDSGDTSLTTASTTTAIAATAIAATEGDIQKGHSPRDLNELAEVNRDRGQHTTRRGQKSICSAVKDELIKILAFLFELDEFAPKSSMHASRSNSANCALRRIYSCDGISGFTAAAAGRAVAHSGKFSSPEILGLDYHSDETDSESIISNQKSCNVDGCSTTNSYNGITSSSDSTLSALNRSSGSNNSSTKTITCTSTSASSNSNVAAATAATAAATAVQSSPIRSITKSKSVPNRTSMAGISEWPAELLDTLYSYVLLAASRTFAAGDAFLILNDLYGGEGLTLCPTRDDSRSSSAEANTTIAVTTSGIKITLRERYNLYAEQAMHHCCDVASLKPLMRFECVTTTLIILAAPAITAAALSNSASHHYTSCGSSATSAAVAGVNSDLLALHPSNPISAIARDHPGSRNPSADSSGPSTALVAALNSVEVQSPETKREACFELFQLLISNPEQLCHRAVTIEPYL